MRERKRDMEGKRLLSIQREKTRISRPPTPVAAKVETIEKKVIVGSAVQKQGFIFNFEKGNDSSSSEEADSF